MFLALVRDGFSQLLVASRTLARAEGLAQLAKSRGIPAQAIPLSWNELSLAAVEAGARQVECTINGIGRDPEGLARIARATGRNIIMGSGY